MQDTILPPGSFAGAPIPWWGKIAAKLVLSRLPVSHSMWSKLNIFRHSYSSDDPEEQVSAVRTRLEKFVQRYGRIPSTVLELGPGEITTSAVVYKALGVERIIFVDVGDFGLSDPEAYTRVAAAAARAGLSPPDLSGAQNRGDVFARCGVQYLVGGLSDLASLKAGSVDFITSVAVVEHIRRGELATTFSELRRVLSNDGVQWHAIDFHDHLGGGLKNLQFPPAMWEAHWMSSSGFYTNRASASHVLELMHNAGLATEIEERRLWPTPPIARNQIAKALRGTWSDEDLRVCAVNVFAYPRGAPAA